MIRAPVPTVSLARLPTPVHALERLSDALGVEVHVKRDDLTGFGLSGNKVRKLEHLLADAKARGATALVTCGGIQSNHARATAVAARQLGMRPVLLLRGAPGGAPDGNLLLDVLLGAEIHWTTPDAYRDHRNDVMAGIADALRARGEVPYVIPEGGSNALGAQGYEDAAAELAAQAEPFDAVFVAVGSGGTLAGLALAGVSGLVGVAVCDDAAFFEARARAIAAESGRSLPACGPATWWVDEAHRGPAYGVATPQIWADIRLAARLEGLLLDPCYTGKAMHALCAHARAGALSGRVLFWHTGGAFGLFGRGAEVAGA